MNREATVPLRALQLEGLEEATYVWGAASSSRQRTVRRRLLASASLLLLALVFLAVGKSWDDWASRYLLKPRADTGVSSMTNTVSLSEAKSRTGGQSSILSEAPRLSGEQRAQVRLAIDASHSPIQEFLASFEDLLPKSQVATFLTELGQERLAQQTGDSVPVRMVVEEGSPFLGDHSSVHSGENGAGASHPEAPEESTHGQEHEPGGFPIFAFLFTSLSVGCILQIIQERFLPSIPYSMMLVIFGMLLALIHQFKTENHPTTWPTWYQSVHQWEAIDPHAVFYIFLPALIFGEAMRMNMKLVFQALGQVLLLACPGVVLGTVLTAAFARGIFPYDWSWELALVFGSIMAATDPVAVVALLNTLGVSPRLTMLISGESLLNDGTAIVLWQICMQLATKEEGDAGWGVVEITIFILRVVVLAVALGYLFGVISQAIIYVTAETRYHTDAMIQVVVTICCAYLTFYIAEQLQASGVLAVVTAGGVHAYISWPRFACRETMITVWEAIDFIGNTLIFILAGLLFGHRVLTASGEHLKFEDIFYLGLLYLATNIIRLVMMVVFLPILNLIGNRISMEQLVVMTWSGLRGAVGLTLAIYVDMDPGVNAINAARFMFHIGGIAMLTTMINAPLTKPLLRWLGLTQPMEVEEKELVFLQQEADKRTGKKYSELVDQKGHDEEEEERRRGQMRRLRKWEVIEVIEYKKDARDQQVDHSEECTGEEDLDEDDEQEEEQEEEEDKDAGDEEEEEEEEAGVSGEEEEEKEDEDRRFRGLAGTVIDDMMSWLTKEKPRDGSPTATPAADTDDDEKLEEKLTKEIFMRLLQHFYWQDITAGVISRTSRVARYLLWSTTHALEEIGTKEAAPLQDMEVIKEGFGENTSWDRMHNLMTKFPFNLYPPFQDYWPNDEVVEKQRVYASLCYITGHEKAQKRLKEVFPDGKGISKAAIDLVVEESNECIKEAKELIGNVELDLVVEVSSKMLVSMLLNSQIQYVDHLKEEGFLTELGANHMAHHLSERVRSTNRNISSTHTDFSTGGKRTGNVRRYSKLMPDMAQVD